MGYTRGWGVMTRKASHLRARLLSMSNESTGERLSSSNEKGRENGGRKGRELTKKFLLYFPFLRALRGSKVIGETEGEITRSFRPKGRRSGYQQ